MKVLKGIITGSLLISTVLQASWWGDLRGSDRAAIIIGSALLLNNTYQASEMKHRENLKDIDTQIRRDYEVQRTIEEAHKKYSNKQQIEKVYVVENKIYNEEIKKLNNYNTEVRNPIKEYVDNPSLGKIIYADEKSALIELWDGTRFMLEKRDLK